MDNERNIKSELELLRGAPIKVYHRADRDVPCLENSDCGCLCKHPLVSVHMVTYNHESYIRQAIEGVMMQKTDFEFELVIGEDCSTDKTRDICIEYQKKHPERIRVLWWHQNVKDMGGNDRRVMAHCRGEYIAFCEGDDYWSDPCKLQKQVDIMNSHRNVGLCFCGGNKLYQKTGKLESWDAQNLIPHTEIPGSDFIRYHLFGINNDGCGPETFLLTASTMIRRSIYINACNRYGIFNWDLSLSDTTMWLGVSSLSDVWYLPDEVCVYRLTNTGACATSNGLVWLDGYIVRLYFAKMLSISFIEWLQSRACDGMRRLILVGLMQIAPSDVRMRYREISRTSEIFGGLRQLPIRGIIGIFGINTISYKLVVRVHRCYKWIW